jgi:methylglutaconyl-CoA hydratase
MKDYQFIQYSVADQIAEITLNRPDKRNALNFEMVAELRQAFKAADESPAVKVIILKANGKAFCAGADLEYLKQLQGHTLQENLADSTNLKELFVAIYRNSKPVIAQIEGHAIAGGSGLATVCDFAFSVPEAKFGYTEVRIGFIPAIVMIFLVRKIGETRAKELLLSGRTIDASQAEAYQMINQVVPAESIADHVRSLAQELITENSGESMALTKRMLGDIFSFPIEQGLQFAAKMNAHARGSADCKKGIGAFLNKEKPSWG